MVGVMPVTRSRYSRVVAVLMEVRISDTPPSQKGESILMLRLSQAVQRARVSSFLISGS